MREAQLNQSLIYSLEYKFILALLLTSMKHQRDSIINIRIVNAILTVQTSQIHIVASKNSW